MDTKEHLIHTIKSWFKTDNEIRSLQKEVNLRKKQELKKQIQAVERDISNTKYFARLN